MPELPEVQTTTEGLKKTVIGQTIADVWTDLSSTHKMHIESVKNPTYFKKFKKEVVGRKIVSVERRAKNILIHLQGNKTILIHLKMTGHLMYGKYAYDKKLNKWAPDPKEKNKALSDPFNRFVHVLFSLSSGKHLAFSDARKFGKVVLLDTDKAHKTSHLNEIGPEPLDEKFNLQQFKERLTKKLTGAIKTVLMDQSVIAGIGNIYSDEMLWLAGIHPEERVKNIPDIKVKALFAGMKQVLKKGIYFGGDSLSDYRNIHGERGEFQNKHNVYRKTGEKCRWVILRSRVSSRDIKNNCKGVILRKVVGSRSAHFCSEHQKLS